MTNEDNFSGKSADDIEKLLNNEAHIEKKEEVKEVVVEDKLPVTPEKDVTIEAPKDETLLLDKFKSQEDLVKAYQELEKRNTKVSQELSEFKKAKEAPVKSDTSTDDYLYKMLFGNDQKVEKESQPVSKVETNSYLEDEENVEVTKLKNELEQGKKVLSYLLSTKTEETEYKKASRKFKDDPYMPWNEQVEKELEDKVFNELPQLKYQKGGYEYAYKLLKADKADEIIKQREEAARNNAVAKREKNETAVVEAPTKSEPEPKFDPKQIEKASELEAFLNKQLGKIIKD